MKTIPKPIAATLAALFAAFIAAVPAAGAAAEAPGSRGEKTTTRDAAPPPGDGDDAEARLSRIEQAMWDRDPNATSLLREWAANDPDDRVRERSVGALALLRDAQAMPVFFGRLDKDPSAAVRRAAAEAIGILRPAVSAKLLTDPLQKDPDPFVRAECARAIGRIGASPAPQELLTALVRDPSAEVRALAAQALSAFPSPDIADFLRAVAMQDNSVLVRIYLVRALADTSPARSVSQFQAAWDGANDPDLRLEAFRGILLAEGGDRWERTGLADADERVRFLAFQAWLARARLSSRRFNGTPDPQFAARLQEFLADHIRGIRELAKQELEALGFRIRPSGFGYAVEP